ncbi:MAG: cobalamin-dependent protein [Magnetococcales bacterium]|nr:cobalamin-dependent protein [Magnetococcales bacterium]
MKKRHSLPESNPLVSYLAQKPETNKSVAPLPEKKLVPITFPTKHDPKVLLVNPPMCIPVGQPKRCIQPSAISYIGGYLRSVNIKVELLDCIIAGWKDEKLADPENEIYIYGMSDAALKKYLVESQPDIIGISITFSQDLNNVYNIAAIAKKCLPDTIIIVGGLHPTIYPEKTITNSVTDGPPNIDYILRGEGEKRLAEFVFNYKNGVIDKNADGLVGIFDDELVINPEINKIQNLDELPLPAYDLLPMDDYFKIDMPCNCFPSGKKTIAIHTSRGCPIGCTFCSSTNFNYKFRTHSPQRVYDEIKYYIDTYGVDEVQFLDDNLLLNSRRAGEIFDIIKPLNIKWCTPNGTMVDSWKPHLMDKAIESGMYQVTLALDGLSEESHKISGKPVHIDSLPAKIDSFRAKNILVHGFVVVGIPGETAENILKGFEWLKTLNFTSVSIYIAQPYPGSILYETELSKGNIAAEDGTRVVKTKSTIANMEVDGEFLEQQVRKFTIDYEKIMKDRETDLWNDRYENKLKRFKDITQHLIIGQGDRINMLLDNEKSA